MSTSPTATNSTPTTAAEFVRTLSDDDKGHVLIALLRELIEIHNDGKCLIPISTLEGESLGYYVPPKAAEAEAAAVLPKLTAERRAELDRRLKNPGPTLTLQELLADLRAWADAAQTQTPSSSESR
jgi:hypothetical protein